MEALRERYNSIISDSLAPSSKTQYERCWRIFLEFCNQNEMEPLGKLWIVRGYAKTLSKNKAREVAKIPHNK